MGLENRKYNGVHYSRYIASWVLAGGNIRDAAFEKWLKSRQMPADVIKEITLMARDGEITLQMSAKRFRNAS